MLMPIFRSLCIFFAAATYLLYGSVALAQRVDNIDVIMLIPSKKSDPFYRQVTKIMRVAADDLTIKLEFLYANDDPMRIVDLSIDISKRKDTPDYVMLVGHRGATENALRHLDNAKIKTALVLAPLPQLRADDFKTGAGKLNHWIGSLLPDERRAGYLLAKNLFAKARQLNLDKKSNLNTMVLLGSRRAPASELRLQGLKQYISENEDIHLHHSYHANWREELAGAYAFRSLSAGDHVSVIWSAGDKMAIGAIGAAEKLNRRPGKDILFGGVGWLPASYSYIESGKMHGSAGGHVLDGAWMLVLLHDHFHQVIPEFFEYQSNSEFIDKENLSLLEKLKDLDYLKMIDFKQFSKLSGSNISYDFDINWLIGG